MSKAVSRYKALRPKLMENTATVEETEEFIQLITNHKEELMIGIPTILEENRELANVILGELVGGRSAVDEINLRSGCGDCPRCRASKARQVGLN